MSKPGDIKPGDFWSRRKAAVEAEEAAIEAEVAQRQEALSREQLDAMPDEEVLERLSLPTPETLTASDDFSVFMSKMVPDRLRRRALRHLWRTNPAFGVVDELVDYGGDFTDAATVVENMQTAYQVGKGMLRHVEVMAQKAEAESAEAATPDSPGERGEPADSDTEITDEAGQIAESMDETMPSDASDMGAESEQTIARNPVETGQSAVESEETAAAPPRRRLKFRYLD